MKKNYRLTFSLTVLFTSIVVVSVIISGFCLFVLYKAQDVHFLTSEISVVTIVILLLSYLFALLISRFLIKRIVRPVEQMIEATNQIALGNFDVRVDSFENKIINETELAQLRESINTMAKALKEDELFRLDLISNFSHEFKTPINCIKGFAHQLQYDDISQEQVKMYSDIIVKESNRLSALSSNVLLLAKLENQTIPANKQLFYIDEQIREAIILLQPQFEEKHIDVDIDLENIQYYGNKEMLPHVWLNVLSNAIKFSHDHGHIWIKCYKENDHIKVLVKDEGIGMSKEELRRVFDRFYQADQSHSVQGNGLGLPLVKAIIKDENGSINIDSEKQKGCSVWITL